nr:hemagglutinin repeat-containing protein [Herbaspirillum sp. ASV7]
MLASPTVTTDDSNSQAIDQGATFSGNTVVVRAGKDVNVTGSNVVSTQGKGVAARNNVNIVAAVDQSTQNNYRQETTSGVMGSGFGVTAQFGKETKFGRPHKTPRTAFSPRPSIAATRVSATAYPSALPICRAGSKVSDRRLPP